MKCVSILSFVAGMVLVSSPAFAVYGRHCPRPTDSPARTAPDDRFAMLVNETLRLSGSNQEIACVGCGVGGCNVEIPTIDSITRSHFQVYSNGKVDYSYIAATIDANRTAVCGYTLFPGITARATWASYVGSDGYLINEGPGLSVDACVIGQPLAALAPRTEQIARALSDAAHTFYSGVSYSGHYIYDAARIEQARNTLRALAPFVGR